MTLCWRTGSILFFLFSALLNLKKPVPGIFSVKVTRNVSPSHHSKAWDNCWDFLSLECYSGVSLNIGHTELTPQTSQTSQILSSSFFFFICFGFLRLGSWTWMWSFHSPGEQKGCQTLQSVKKKWEHFNKRQKYHISRASTIQCVRVNKVTGDKLKKICFLLSN